MIAENLKIGSYYWVKFGFDPEFCEDEPWLAELMPARLMSFNEHGKPEFLGIGAENIGWAVVHIGPEILAAHL